jgi:hypothetical protein
MKRTNRLWLIAAALFFFSLPATSQSILGAGYGSFNVPGSMQQFKGWCPNIKYEYLSGDMRQSVYADVSYFTHSRLIEGANYIDPDGNIISSPDVIASYKYVYSQLGFKTVFGGDVDEKKLLPFVGGGFTLAMEKAVYSNKDNLNNDNEYSEKRFLWGFHFSAGAQYNFGPAIIELKGNLDIILKPIDTYSNSSNILKNTRLSILIPITH